MITRQLTKGLLGVAVLGLMLTGCNKKEKSSATGWNYNDSKWGGFEKHEYAGQETGPGLVLVRGGAFTMGSSEQDVTYEHNNIERKVTVPSFYMDETEVTNNHYREYVWWLSRVYVDYPEVAKNALPDTNVWRSKLAYNEPYVDYYYRHPAYQDYPVVGVSWLQASNYCAWRSDRVNEYILVREGILKWTNDQQGEPFVSDAYLAGKYENSNNEKGQLIDLDPSNGSGADGKKIRDIHKDEVEDYAAFDGFSIYNDLRLKHVDFTYGNYPYTIEYEYEVTHNGLQSYSTWAPQRYKTSVEKSIFELTLPADMEFRYKAFNITQLPQINNEGGKKRNAWQLLNKIVVSRESNAPDTYQPLPVLRTLPNNFEVDGYKGNMESWQAFGRFMYELNNNRDNLSPAMVQKVKSLTANATTNEEKIAALYHYLQENMRYVSVQLGIGGWQTFDAEYVEKNKYGDCKALTNFMKGMLKTAGIKAYASLITAGDQNMEIKEDFPAPYFNHVILNVPEENIWLECTSTNNPVNYLGTSTADRPTLLITEKGGVLTRTPAISNNFQKGKTQIILGEDGSAKVECATTLTGKLHEVFRYIVNNYSQEDQEKWLETLRSPTQL